MGSQRQVKPFIKTQTVIGTVCSVSNINSFNQQDRPRQLLAVVWHHIHPY